MKKLTLIITMVLGITMMSCVSKSQESRIISTYLNTNDLYQIELLVGDSIYNVFVIANDYDQAVKFRDNVLKQNFLSPEIRTNIKKLQITQHNNGINKN